MNRPPSVDCNQTTPTGLQFLVEHLPNGGGQVQTDTATELELAGRFLQKGFTDSQAKLKAVWQNPQIASICSEMPNMTLLMSNVSAAVDKIELSAQDKREFKSASRELGRGYVLGVADTWCEVSEQM